MKHFFSAFLILVTTLIFAQDIQQSQMLSMKGHIVKSTANGKSYQLYVSLPSGYDPAKTDRYPVLYILDANYSYPIISSMHKLLDSGGEIEQVIIVAIGDEDQSDKQWLISRTLDYTPSNDFFANSDIARGANVATATIKSGGASAFLSTIRKDIIPLIDKNYKTTADRGIAGHSLGGLFAGYCLLTSPDLFTKYGISSPSFLWNKNEILTTQKFYAVKPFSPTKVFISVGSKEPAVLYPPIDAFIKSLREQTNSNITLSNHVFENETHTSVMAPSITRTLKELYSKQQ